ncbi:MULTISPECIES: glycosyltransferase [Synechococcales]|uniref:glycosyltransferase n=1 Tax=Synechococcus sp. CS-1325 TaxID=2847979 RepID=UPI00223B890A|nr:glycosyltransferase [Synechococcus sp. CS-1325]
MEFTQHQPLEASRQLTCHQSAPLPSQIVVDGKAEPLIILHINESDIGGGAGRAAYRIYRCLAEHGPPMGLYSKLRTISQTSDDPTVIGGTPSGEGPFRRRLRPRLNHHGRRGFTTENTTIHSIAWPATGLAAELRKCPSADAPDLIHLHWLGESTLSIEEVGQLRQPLVWTLHDQWAFCGAEHYTNPPGLGETCSTDERFTLGYTPASRPTHETGPDLNRRTWLRKQRAWRRPIQIVCPSNWMADCARRSSLMGSWPITVIPHPINLKTWAPVDQHQARALLVLPLEAPLVLFGAIGGTADHRKGADLLLAALQRLRIELADTPMADLQLVVFGQSRPERPPDLGFPIHYAGRLQDDLSLRLHYAAADVMVVPSRQEAFGQTASEAHACGTPVVAYRTGGLPDIVDDRVTGALADPFDPASLAAAIRWVLEDPLRCSQLAEAARARAERLWNPARIAGLYAEVYRQALHSPSSPRNSY